ncbi:MAG: redoxin domain-containing protein [Fuerstiella sp.]|jgi:peroxiredoxin|nr:redoxin domain-containing protein [Fuerstiella sp.]MCP4508041.1 redoxin domain-containing protein [Fuerstiella sp.]
MRTVTITLSALLLLWAVHTPACGAKDVKRLEIGSPCPKLDLPGVDGRIHKLNDFATARLLVVVFTCNHCPTAQAYEERLIKLEADYRSRGVRLIAISPNDPKSVRLDELGYTDVGDTLEDMKYHAKRVGFRFPYLYDGKTQRVSTAFGVLATPHVFIFDQQRRLRYNGRIDDADITLPKSHDARNAIEAMLAGRPVSVATTRVFGCSTKWAEKRESARQSVLKWDAEPVRLQQIESGPLQELIANRTGKYRLVNLWSITCVPCVAEQPKFVTINRMYRKRHFELITIVTDDVSRSDLALKTLKSNKVSCRNLVFTGGDRDDLAEIVDGDWPGPLPYTILIAPGGKIVKRWSDEIDPQDVKTTLADALGRTYAGRK